MGLYIQPNVAPPSVLVLEQHLSGPLELLHLVEHTFGKESSSVLYLAATPL